MDALHGRGSGSYGPVVVWPSLLTTVSLDPVHCCASTSPLGLTHAQLFIGLEVGMHRQT
jgi:hypothetical protein